MKNKKTLAIFGGSFNPPLNSHFSLAEQMLTEYKNIEKVIFVPVSTKYNKKGLLSNEHRYNMLKLVCDENEKFEVSDIELKQEKQLDTLETLQLLQEEYQDYTLCFTMGTDNLKAISKWGLAEELVSSFKMLVIERDEDSMEEIIKADPFLIMHEEAFMKVKENIRSNISSTFVREKIKRGKSIRYFTPDKVYFYIKENNLYNI